jgi:hypothetical protein
VNNYKGAGRLIGLSSLFMGEFAVGNFAELSAMASLYGWQKAWLLRGRAPAHVAS